VFDTVLSIVVKHKSVIAKLKRGEDPMRQALLQPKTDLRVHLYVSYIDPMIFCRNSIPSCLYPTPLATDNNTSPIRL